MRSLIVRPTLLNLPEHDTRPALELRIAFSIEEPQRVVRLDERTRKRRLVGNAGRAPIARPSSSAAARAPGKQGAFLGRRQCRNPAPVARVTPMHRPQEEPASRISRDEADEMVDSAILRRTIVFKGPVVDMNGGRYELLLTKPESVATVASRRARRVRSTTKSSGSQGRPADARENGEVGRDCRARPSHGRERVHRLLVRPLVDQSEIANALSTQGRDTRKWSGRTVGVEV